MTVRSVVADLPKQVDDKQALMKLITAARCAFASLAPLYNGDTQLENVFIRFLFQHLELPSMESYDFVPETLREFLHDIVAVTGFIQPVENFLALKRSDFAQSIAESDYDFLKRIDSIICEHHIAVYLQQSDTSLANSAFETVVMREMSLGIRNKHLKAILSVDGQWSQIRLRLYAAVTYPKKVKKCCGCFGAFDFFSI